MILTHLILFDFFPGSDVSAIAGSTVVRFNRMTHAGNLSHFKGISIKQVHLVDAGGGLYTVTLVSGVSQERDDNVIDETYLIDGDLP